MKRTNINHFNIRVYGLWLNEQEEVLVALEKIRGSQFVKFPGGGLEFGEGVMDCLKREWMEELGRTFDRAEHFYTTEFFQQSAFHPNHQVISIYYRIYDSDFSPILHPKHDPALVGFRWETIREDMKLSLPIDQIVGKLLWEQIKKKVE